MQWNNIKIKGTPIRLMEVCGTHTSTIVRSGIREILPEGITLVSGPGCPVCVTGASYIDKLCALALDGAVICTFGDMLKVPGTQASLAEIRAQGCDIRMVYSPFDILEMAKNDKNKQFVFAAVGFETIVPVYALLIERLEKEGIANTKLLCALKKIDPALEMLCVSDVDGFIAPGHVAAVTGSRLFEPLAKKFHRPFCVAGFTPDQVMGAISDLILQINEHRFEVHNLYTTVVTHEGNKKAQESIARIFTEGDAHWRGLGNIPHSGLFLCEEYQKYDAGSRYIADMPEHTACRCGDVICGKIAPADCPLYGTACTPMHAKGPCMVSSEGACGIWYQCGLGSEQ